MKYDNFTTQRLRELPITDVCSRLGITLYGMGMTTRRARCWYHDDRHPSMHINQRKNIFKCFVCGKGGDVIRLVMDHEGLSFVEACDWLAREFSVTVVTDTPRPRQPIPSAQAEKPAQPGHSRQHGQSGQSDKSVQAVQAVQAVVPLSPNLVQRSLSLASEFCRSVVAAGYLSEPQLRHAAGRYRLGASRRGSVIFWEIDHQGHCHNGKFMHYQPDCHRDKQRTPTWAAAELKKSGILPPDFDNPHCLFGQHLLSMDSLEQNATQVPGKADSFSTTTVCIVESEKSAVILSEHFPQCLWMSCGGLQMLKPPLLEPLVGHKVILFPDTDEEGEVFKSWSAVALEAQKRYPFRHPLRVSPILEQNASADQKRRKIDLVDFLFEHHPLHKTIPP